MLRRMSQSGDVVGISDLNADQVRVIRHEAEKIQRLQNADDVFALDNAVAVHVGDHDPVHSLPDHDLERIT